MALTLKMRLNAANKAFPGGDLVATRYELAPVSGKENEPWSKWTPSGKLEFTVTNPEAPELEPGEYIVTLTKL